MRAIKKLDDLNDLNADADFDVIYVDDNMSEALIFDSAVGKLEEKPSCLWIQNSSMFLEVINKKGLLDKVKLFIIDLQMPVVDGFECKKALEEAPGYKKTPTVMMSNSKEQRDVRKAYEMNFNSYLVKDSSIQEFRKKIENTFLYWLGTNHYN